MTRVENKRTYRGPGVYIGRPGPWGNPYTMGLDGNREQVIEKYRLWLWEQLKAGVVKKEELAALDGQVLLCWCKPKACHGDVLVRAIKWACES